MRNGLLIGYALLLALACWLVWPALVCQAQTNAPAGFSRLGTTVLVGTNGVVEKPSNFWLENVVGAGDIGVDTDAQGRLRIHVMITTNMSVSVQWNSLLNMPPVLQDHAALSNAVAQATTALQTEIDPAFAAWLAGDWVDINASIQLAIQQAAQSANLGGDLLTEDGNATVIAVRNIPYAAETPTAGQAWLMGEDGIMRPGRVAQEGGVTNYVAATGTGNAQTMPADSVGFTRDIRGGQVILPFYINGTEIGFFGTNGLSLVTGSLNYLNDVFLEAYFRAQDGSAATPAFSFSADPTMGLFRKSVTGGYAMAYGQGGNATFWVNGDKVVIETGHVLELPVGTMLVPSLSMAANTGRMGWFSKVDTATGDKAWAFTHGLYGEILSFTPQGIRLSAGKTIYGFEAPGSTGSTEDPIQRSATVTAWTNAGGTYATAQVVATSPALSNGVASVTYALSGAMVAVVEIDDDGLTQTNWYNSVPMQTVVEMSDLTQTNWVAYAPFATPGYIRISLSDALPTSGEPVTTISNIIVQSWTRPDLYGVTNDTAGQVLLVDPPTQDRQAASKAYVDAQAGAADASGWSAFPATQTVRVNGQLLQIGPVWTVLETNNTLTVSQAGEPVLSFYYTSAAAEIGTVSITGGVVTAGIVTNGVISRPLLQWSAAIDNPAWQTLTPQSETYPDVTTNGYYEIVATLPGGTSGFLRAVQEDTPIAEVRGHLLPGAGGTYDLGSAAKPWRSLYLGGDTLYIGGFPISASTNGVLTFGGQVFAMTEEFIAATTGQYAEVWQSLNDDFVSSINASISNSPAFPAYTPSTNSFDWTTLPTNSPIGEWEPLIISTNTVPE